MKSIEDYATLESSQDDPLYNESGFRIEKWKTNDGRFLITLSKARGLLGAVGWVVDARPPVDARFKQYEPVGCRNGYAAAKRLAGRWVARHA